MTDTILEIENASYVAGGRTLLDQVNWALHRGQHWAVVGPNGSGKTTLLRIACGYLWPTAGRVRRLGRELTDLSTLRRSIGWIAHDLLPRIPPHHSARDTVMAGCFAQVGFKDLPACQPTDDDYQAADNQLAALDCQNLAERPFGILSQGEKQKILIARARLAQPLLLVLDEPCAGMDPGAREKFLDTLEKLAHDATSPTIVLVTHHVEEIMPAMKHTLVMAEGRIVAAGPTGQVISRETLQNVYGVPVARLEADSGRTWPIWAKHPFESTTTAES